ncbi:hypothetical protein GCM10023237_66890 [Streptomyces coeruleoprunus]
MCGVCADTWDPLEVDRRVLLKRFDAHQAAGRVSREQRHRIQKGGQGVAKSRRPALGGILEATLVRPWVFT